MGGTQYGLHVSACSELEELKAKGLVTQMMLLQRTDHDNYTLTSLGRQCVKPCLELRNPVPILQYKRKPVQLEHVGEPTLAELILALADSGWRDVEHNMSKILQPYKQGGPKIWYSSKGKKTSKLYLQVLAQAQTIFRSGSMQQIHHFQSQNYYRCILEGCKNVLPNQPLSYYKMISKSNGGSGHPSSTAFDAGAATAGADTYLDEHGHPTEIKSVSFYEC